MPLNNRGRVIVQGCGDFYLARDWKGVDFSKLMSHQTWRMEPTPALKCAALIKEPAVILQLTDWHFSLLIKMVRFKLELRKWIFNLFSSRKTGPPHAPKNQRCSEKKPHFPGLLSTQLPFPSIKCVWHSQSLIRAQTISMASVPSYKHVLCVYVTNQ